MSIYTKQFAEISKNDSFLAGGKGASLGEMTQAGIPVPEGYIIVSIAFQDFFKESGISLVYIVTPRECGFLLCPLPHLDLLWFWPVFSFC